MTIVRQVCPILHTAFNYHVAEFNLLTRPDLHFEKFVAAFFKING
jgi:hypothetical protein